MSIGKQVSECIAKMEARDFHGALFAICAAIDATAVREKSTRGRKAFKDFVHENMSLITRIAFGGVKILNLNVAFDHPEIEKDANGLVSFEQVLYHAVRCGLYHETTLPQNLLFTEERIIEAKNGALRLPAVLIYGFITAVVASPANVNEHLRTDATLNLRNFPILVSKLWGKRNELFWLLDTFEAYEAWAKEQCGSPVTAINGAASV